MQQSTTGQRPWDLVLERKIDLNILRGEQGLRHKISYTEWIRDTRGYIKGKGRTGSTFLSVMEWPERLLDTPGANMAFKGPGLPE